MSSYGGSGTKALKGVCKLLLDFFVMRRPIRFVLKTAKDSLMVMVECYAECLKYC